MFNSITPQVFLVGAGPGDPDLLTLKALKAINQADVIVHDALVSDEVLSLCPKTAEYIYVGKRASAHTMAQEQINELLVELALTGKTVVRLKGGDPYIFGRGGEEALYLSNHHIRYQVIPGITAAAACSAAVGIPLTHRDCAQSLQFITGHQKVNAANETSDTINWPLMAKSKQTLVIYMGLLRSSEIKQQLLCHGRASDTPVAIIENGTRDNQRVFTGQLFELDDLVANHHIGSPALIIVGEVVDLYQQLNSNSFYMPTEELSPSEHRI